MKPEKADVFTSTVLTVWTSKWLISSIARLCSVLVKHSRSGLNTHWKWFFSQLNLVIMILVCAAGCQGDDLCYLGNYIYHMQSFLYLSDAKYVILHGLRHLSWYAYALLMYSYNTYNYIVFHILPSPKYYLIEAPAPRIAGLHKICR